MAKGAQKLPTIIGTGLIGLPSLQLLLTSLSEFVILHMMDDASTNVFEIVNTRKHRVLFTQILILSNLVLMPERFV